MEQHSNRLYEHVFPPINDIVMTRITSIDDNGAKCILLEYGDIPGFVPIGEFTKGGRIKSMRKIFQIGSNYPLQVISVSPDKGYIDLSKKHVTENESKQCEVKFKESKIADNIVRRTAELCSLPKVVIYQQYIWPLLNTHGVLEISTEPVLIDGQKNIVDGKSSVVVGGENSDDKVKKDDENGDVVVGEENDEENNEENEENGEVNNVERGNNNTALHVLQKFMFNPSIIIFHDSDNLTIGTILLDLVKKKLQHTLKKISAIVQLTCFGPEGINAIKDVLTMAVENSKKMMEKTVDEVVEVMEAAVVGKTTVEMGGQTDEVEGETPINEQPINEQPVNEQHVNDQHINERPVNVQLVNEQLVNEQLVNEQLNLHVHTLGCPEYSLNVETKNVERGKEFLGQVISYIQIEMQKKNGGGFVLKRGPFVLGEE